MSDAIFQQFEALKNAIEELKKNEAEKANNATNTDDNIRPVEDDGVEANEDATEDATDDVDIPESARPFQPIAFDKKKPLAIDEAYTFLKQESKAISQMPFKPKAGEVILYKAESDKSKNDWRANGHRWFQGNGGRWTTDGLLKRRVANLVTPSSNRRGVPDFQMFSWTHRDRPLFTLVQFVGNDSLSVDFPHKNSKKGVPYVRSAPSVLREVEASTDKPFKVYQNQVRNAPPDASTQNLRVPRCITQVRNAKQRFRKDNKGTDSFTNLIRLSTEHEDIRFLMTAPDLVMVTSTSEMLKQTRSILKIDYDTARQKQLLGYSFFNFIFFYNLIHPSRI